MQIYLNGSFPDLESAHVPVTDRGFLFGDGIYEVIRAVDGRLFRVDAHLERLGRSLDGLKIRLDTELKGRLAGLSRQLLAENDQLDGEATIYIQITRGAAWPRTHTFPEPEPEPTVMISTSKFAPYSELHERGAAAITLADVRWTRCNLKTINLLPNTLARQQALESGADNALFVRDGVLTESPNANIFGVKGGTLFTFPSSNYILDGITRSVVIEIANTLGIPVRYNPVREDEIFDMDELFFTGTTTDIMPVVSVNGRPLGSGHTGPVVRKIQDNYQKMLQG